MKNTKRLFVCAALACAIIHAPAALAQRTCRLTVDELFALSDKNNRSIHAHRFAQAAAAEAVQSARSSRLPSIDFSVSASLLGNGWLTDRDFSGGMVAHIPHFGNNLALEASQTVYAGGAVSAGITMAELKLQTAQAAAEQNRQDMRFLLVGNYLELYKIDNQAAVYRSNIEQTQRLLSEIRARHKEGLAIPNDITRYELQLQRLELSLIQTENCRSIINDRLTTALGLEPDVIIEPNRAEVDRLPAMLSEAHWLQAADESAPALRMAALGSALQLQGIRIAEAERRPSLMLFAGNRLDGPITIEVPPLNKNLNYWYLGVGMSLKLSALYKAGRNIRRAKYAAQQAEALRQLASDNLHSDVHEAYTLLGEAFKICRMQEKNLELATQNYEVVRNRFTNELALLTDMLDADNTKLRAELDVANARALILKNWYRLKKIAGEL